MRRTVVQRYQKLVEAGEVLEIYDDRIVGLVYWVDMQSVRQAHALAVRSFQAASRLMGTEPDEFGDALRHEAKAFGIE